MAIFYYKEKGVKRKQLWDDRIHYRKGRHRDKDFNKIFKKFKGCHYNDALSYYLTIQKDIRLIEQFKADIEDKKKYYNYKWPGWRINPEGIIELKLRDKKPRLLYTADYKTEKYVKNKKTGKIIKDDHFYFSKDWEPITKVIEGEVLEFDSKREPLYKRKLSEKIKYLKKQKRNKVKNTIMPNDVYYVIAYNFFNNKRVDNELVNLFDYGINLTNKFNTNPEALVVFDQLKDLLPKRTSILILKLINNEKSG